MSLSKPVFLSATLALACFMCVGCGGTTNNAQPSSTSKTPGKAAVHDEHAHAHPEEGPHHGHLIELGKEEYHAELTHDEATKTVTVYVLDSAAKAAVPIIDKEIVMNLVVEGKPQQVKLAAAPQESDPMGQSSRFAITDEKVLEALEAPKTSGRLNLTIAGKSYTGQIEHQDHEEHKDGK